MSQDARCASRLPSSLGSHERLPIVAATAFGAGLILGVTRRPESHRAAATGHAVEAPSLRPRDEVIAKGKDAEAKARQAADAARKAATYLSLFTAFSMLIGAFIAGADAAFCGHQRDEFAERPGGSGRRGV